ncbi:MAG: triose-phosphate isomerase [Sutterella wadsworthensis]
MPCQTRRSHCRPGAPFVYLSELVRLFKDTGVAVGPDGFAQGSGAFTGEVSAAMLADIGMSLLPVGHSNAAPSGVRTMNPWPSGENLGSRHRPVVRWRDVADSEAGLPRPSRRRLRTVLTRVPVAASRPSPMNPSGPSARTHGDWQAARRSRGSARLLTEADAEAAAKTPSFTAAVRPTMPELFSQPDIDGGLIGGAALKAEDFHSVCAAARVD